MRDMKLVVRTRGQVMVLGCVALLVMALMLMASYTMSNAVYEKIRVQSHADAQAYSVAIVEARALNSTAHFNRAIAATLVAQMSLHSWMAIMTADVAMLQTGMQIMAVIMVMEIALGCYPYNVSHCPHVIDAIITMWNFYRAWSQWNQTVQGLESKFNEGVQGLSEMVEALHKRQKAILSTASSETSSSGNVLSALRGTNASRAQYVTALDGMNSNDFSCALEGAESDGCSGPRSRPKASNSERSKLIQNTANVSRPIFDRLGPSAAMISHSNFAVGQAQVPKDALTTGEWMHMFTSQSKVGNSGTGGSNKGDQAKAVGAEVTGGFATVLNFHCVSFGLPFSASIESNQSGGSHNGSHTASHDKFKGVNQAGDPCGGSESCFVNFRATPDPAKDFGFPTTYGGVSQDIRMYKGKGHTFGTNAPWELNQQKKVKIELIAGRPVTIDYTPRDSGKAFAVSKGKVYFHQLGNWQVAPNLFDPFWRAKLHFFDKNEFRQVLGATGDSNGIQINSGGAPVEGEE